MTDVPNARASGGKEIFVESTSRAQIPPAAGMTVSCPLTVHVIPQAHIDLVWYWSPAEAVRMVLHTFRGHVEKLESDTLRTFAQSQAWAYDVVRREDPELFARVQALVAEGRWEPVGGEWVEADTVIPGPEARLRQFIFGQRFFQEHFGHKAKVGWCPDAFIVLPASFPQMLRQAGMDTFVHKRPRERYGRLPVLPYRWRGADGSEVLAFRANNMGKGLPVLSEGIKAPSDKGDLAVTAEIFVSAGLRDLWGPMGVGDVGGVNSYQLPPAPSNVSCLYSTPGNFFATIAREADAAALPVVTGSLPPEFLGALTTRAQTKSLNRRAENCLQQAEFLMALGKALGFDCDIHELDPSWRQILFTQFHDAACGCGTEDIMPIVERMQMEALDSAESARERLMRRIAESTPRPADGCLPIVVFNPLGHYVDTAVECRVTLPPEFLDLVPRGETRTLTHKVDCRTFMPASCALEAVNEKGEAVPVMVSRYAQLQKRFAAEVRFQADRLPPFGYATFHLRKIQRASRPAATHGSTFQTDRLRVQFDMERGGIARLEMLGSPNLAIESTDGPLGQLRLHHTGAYPIDYEQELRAWHTGFTGETQIPKPSACDVLRCNGERQVVSFLYSFGESRVRQEFLIEPGSNEIEAQISGDWQEVEKYLKAHFSFGSTGPLSAFADLPYGWTDALPAGSEYAMQYFCGLRDANRALHISNDGRYGCMWDGGSLSISIIRCATYPANISDRGNFLTRYRIKLLDAGAPNWRADAFRSGYEYNIAPCCYAPEHSGNKLPAAMSLMPPTAAPIMATCLKPAYDGNDLVLRLFNCAPDRSNWTADPTTTWESLEEEGFLEDGRREARRAVRSRTLNPFGIVTLRSASDRHCTGLGCRSER